MPRAKSHFEKNCISRTFSKDHWGGKMEPVWKIRSIKDPYLTVPPPETVQGGEKDVSSHHCWRPSLSMSLLASIKDGCFLFFPSEFGTTKCWIIFPLVIQNKMNRPFLFLENTLYCERGNCFPYTLISTGLPLAGLRWIHDNTGQILGMTLRKLSNI